MFKELRVKSQRLMKRLDGLIVFLLTKIGVAEIAVEHRHIFANLDGFLVGAHGFAVFLALVPDGADIVLRVGVSGIDLSGAFVIFERQRERSLLVQRDAELVQINRITRIFIREALVSFRGFAIVLARHVNVGELLGGDFRAHHDYRRIRRALLERGHVGTWHRRVRGPSFGRSTVVFKRLRYRGAGNSQKENAY